MQTQYVLQRLRLDDILKMATVCSPKRWYLLAPTSLHGVAARKNSIVIFTAVRISNLAADRI